MSCFSPSPSVFTSAASFSTDVLSFSRNVDLFSFFEYLNINIHYQFFQMSVVKFWGKGALRRGGGKKGASTFFFSLLRVLISFFVLLCTFFRVVFLLFFCFVCRGLFCLPGLVLSAGGGEQDTKYWRQQLWATHDQVECEVVQGMHDQGLPVVKVRRDTVVVRGDKGGGGLW